MPLGQIQARELTEKEKRWRSHWLKWEGMELKSIVPELRHLSREEFRAWLYSIDPRAALLFLGEPWFREVTDYQLNKRWYHEWRDSVCRLLKL